MLQSSETSISSVISPRRPASRPAPSCSGKVRRVFRITGLSVHNGPDWPFKITGTRSNGARLWRETRDAGFAGGLRVVTEWANRQRLADPVMAKVPGHAAPPAPAARRVARILTADLPSLKEAERTYIERLLALSPALDVVRGIARRFAIMVRARDGAALEPWLVEAANSELSSFAQGLKQDEAAVRAALTLSWSSGAVEGNVARLKLIKRQAYGRAKLDLLAPECFMPHDQSANHQVCG